MNIELSYVHGSYGWHTEARYADATGHPLAARFAGRVTLDEAVDYIKWARQNDRNRQPK